MNERTPGPWVVEQDEDDAPHVLVVDEQGVTVARCYQQAYDTWQAKDNAHLIAAAPDLLAALESLFDHCAMVHKHWGEGDNAKQADAAQAAARAAIAKVKGG
jgi:hypothetical protein